MISPPVAIAAFVAANLAGADHNRTGWTAMAFGWTLFVVPFLFVFSPSLLLKGDPVTIAVDFVAAIAGVWLVAAAVMGYSVRPLGFGARLFYALTGICIFLPADTFGTGRWINLGGVVLAATLFGWEWLHRAERGPKLAAAPVAATAAAVAVSGDQSETLERMGIHGTIEGA
jgi:TRAP-type uncharacterized transport system fused permease subunit